MKFNLAGLFVISLGATTAFASSSSSSHHGSSSSSPKPTPHLQSQDWPHAVDVGRLLEDPKVYLKHVKSLMSDDKKAKLYAQKWASATNDPAFTSSLSKALASEFGTKTAGAAMVQFSNVIQKNVASKSAAAVAAASSAAAAASPSANNADSTPNTTSVIRPASNIVSGGASALMTSTYTLAVMAAIPAVLVVVL